MLPGTPRHNLVITLLTVSEDGYPNVCLLSPFQVVAKDDHVIFLAVYGGSRTQANLSRRNHVTLTLFLPPAAYYIKGETREVESPRTRSELRGQVLYRLRVTQATRDYYRDAPIKSAVEFEQSGVFSYYSQVYESLVGVMKTVR